MTKYRFKDGFECVANSKEEAKIIHRASAGKYEDNLDSLFNKIWEAESGYNYLEKEINNSIKALDIVNKDNFSKDIVKEYVSEIKKYLDESGLKDKISSLNDSAHSLERRPSNMKEWKEMCLNSLPSDCSLADYQNAEEKLEELCH